MYPGSLADLGLSGNEVFLRGSVEHGTAKLQQRVENPTHATEEVAIARHDAEKRIAQLAKVEVEVNILIS
eukprot:COSAG02_NODE_6076_length_3817_cov_1.652501_6_plen_70_part_00